MSRHNSLNIGKEITVTIDGKECKSTFGHTILEIARENGIYIPTMCYLTKVKPIASCRMCIVNVDGVDGPILSCQEKAVDGIVVTTQNADLHEERQNIMKLYNVNHPLECGVCDQSGECDLQNKTMEFGVEDQNFTVREQSRPVENWGHVSYDPALCIMCEKCVRVSTEITGDEALKLKFGGYSSSIVNVKQDKNYASLGEAAAVCPVGALVDTNFKYSTNAWELEKIPSACPHCGGGCQMVYEVKNNEIYRVSNDAEFTTMCAAARYGFDYANKDVTKDKDAFDLAVNSVNSASNILFSSTISNEEAHMLQLIKEQKDVNLVCHEARAYQKFMSSYSSITGNALYGGSLDQLSNSKAVIVFGSKIADDSPIVKYHINMASKWHRARVTYMHAFEDAQMDHIATQKIVYDVGSEEKKASQLVAMLMKDIDAPKEVKDYLATVENNHDEELKALAKSLIKKHDFSLVIGPDLYSHPRAENIAKIFALLEKYAGFNVICVPPAGNAMGVSLICDLDDELSEGTTVGYNVKADYTLSSFGDGDLDMPAMNQQEGTLTTLNKRVVPMNAAVEYGGYELNDILNELGINAEYAISYTEELPVDKGFKAIDFDSLPDGFTVNGVENRGYILDEVSVPDNGELEKLGEIHIYGDNIVYNCNSSEQFSPLTSNCNLIKEDGALLGSLEFAVNSGLKDGQNVSYTIDDISFNRVFKIDTSIRGNIALNPTHDMGLSSALISSYRFCSIEFNEKVGS